MARVYSHSVLEAFSCAAKGLDSLRPRHGREGPSRQGQAWHGWISLYLKHLVKTGNNSDMDKAREIWRGIAAFLSPDDDLGIADVVEKHVDVSFAWFLAGTEQESEDTRVVTLDRRVVPLDRVADIDGPVFRFTADATWRGYGPYHVDAAHLTGGAAAHCLDWKTHHHIEHVDSPSNNRQTKRYSAARFPEDPFVVAWLGFPRRFYFEHAVHSQSELDEAWQATVVEPIGRIERMIERGDVVPERVVGAQCKSCDMLKGCDAAQRYPFDLVNAEGATPEQRLIAMKIAEEIAEVHKDALRDALAAKGEVSDGTHKIHYIEARQVDYDSEKVVEVLREFMTDTQINRAFSINKTSIERALKEATIPVDTRKALLEACASGAPVKVSTRLHTTKVGEQRSENAGNRRRRRGPAEGVGDVE